jgi:hypothetical protein
MELSFGTYGWLEPANARGCFADARRALFTVTELKGVPIFA